jgi:hypothetical protein
MSSGTEVSFEPMDVSGLPTWKTLLQVAKEERGHLLDLSLSAISRSAVSKGNDLVYSFRIIRLSSPKRNYTQSDPSAQRYHHKYSLALNREEVEWLAQLLTDHDCLPASHTSLNSSNFPTRSIKVSSELGDWGTKSLVLTQERVGKRGAMVKIPITAFAFFIESLIAAHGLIKKNETQDYIGTTDKEVGKGELDWSEYTSPLDAELHVAYD